MAIIAMVMAMGLPAIERVTYQQVNSTARKMVGLVRTIRNDALLLNSLYRLGFNLEERTYWVESQGALQLISEGSSERIVDKKTGKPLPSGFSKVEKYSSEPISLPNGVTISSIAKESEGLITQGIVFIHFFPNGFNEHAIIHLSKEGKDEVAYSVIIRPTSGRVEIESDKITTFQILE